MEWLKMPGLQDGKLHATRTCEGREQVPVPPEARLRALAQQPAVARRARFGCLQLRPALLSQRDVRAVAEVETPARVAGVQRRPEQLYVPAGQRGAN